MNLIENRSHIVLFAKWKKWNLSFLFFFILKRYINERFITIGSDTKSNCLCNKQKKRISFHRTCLLFRLFWSCQLNSPSVIFFFCETEEKSIIFTSRLSQRSWVIDKQKKNKLSNIHIICGKGKTIQKLILLTFDDLFDWKLNHFTIYHSIETFRVQKKTMRIFVVVVFFSFFYDSNNMLCFNYDHKRR